MRGADGNEPLDQTQEQLAAQEPAPAPEQAEIGRSIDNVEERRAALDQELAQMREAGRERGQQIAPQEPSVDRQSDIDRALALQSEGQLSPEQSAEARSLEDPVAPEQWTDRGGMVEQQASAMEWLEHSDEVRRERAGQEYEAAAHELTNEDQELLEAARSTEAQTQQQEMGQSQVHEPSGP